MLIVAAMLLVLSLTIVLAWATIPAFIVLGVGALIYVIVAAIRAYNGELVEYWLVGSWARQIVGI